MAEMGPQEKEYVRLYNEAKLQAQKTEASKLPILRDELKQTVFDAKVRLIAIEDELRERSK